MNKPTNAAPAKPLIYRLMKSTLARMEDYDRAQAEETGVETAAAPQVVIGTPEEQALFDLALEHVHLSIAAERDGDLAAARQHIRLFTDAYLELMQAKEERLSATEEKVKRELLRYSRPPRRN